MIKLNNEQTLNLIYNSIKTKALKKRYNYKTLHKWWCLNCGDTMFVKYNTVSLNNIFCDKSFEDGTSCKDLVNYENMIQHQYLRKLKEEQLKLIETNLKI